MTTQYNIITCDGGGIRGLITAMLLNDLVSNPPMGFTNNILNNVSLYAGTSTGGIIAIGLANGLLPKALVGLYENSCKHIFKKYDPLLTPAPAIVIRQPGAADVSLENFFWVKYTDTGLYKTLKDQIRNPDSPLSDLATGVLVSTFMMSDSNTDPWRPLALTNLPGSAYSSVSSIDAAMCSSAAPIYFPPHEVTLSNGMTMWCADGGLFANNPTALTLASVLGSNVLNGLNMTLQNVRMLSIGTGVTIDTVTPGGLSDRYRWGVWRWLNPEATPPEPDFPLLNSLFDGQSELADIEMAGILGPSQYQRANPILQEPIALDACGSIKNLKNVAEGYISDSSGPWPAIKQWAYANFV